jgi:hypothetical protein
MYSKMEFFLKLRKMEGLICGSSFIRAYAVMISTAMGLTVAQFVRIALTLCEYEFQWVFLSPPLVSDLLKQSTHICLEQL